MCVFDPASLTQAVLCGCPILIPLSCFFLGFYVLKSVLLSAKKVEVTFSGLGFGYLVCEI